MAPRVAVPAILLLLLAFPGPGTPADPPNLDRAFTETVRPFVTKYCAGCHSGPQAMAQLDLARFQSIASVTADHRHWALIQQRIKANEMPPKQAGQPPAEARQQVVEWIDAVLKNEARKNAGDPGVVLARRLSNAEYNYTVRDLTGVDIRPAREFPVDPANVAGFDNSGESLAMSPSLMNKYLEAAREVANHMVLKISGIAFAPDLALAETDRDKYCVAQIIDFYNRQNTEYSDYFLAAWQYKHRVALGKPRATIADFAAASNKASAKYAALIWKTLEETKEEAGPLAKLQTMWRGLPAPKGNQPALAKAGTEKMRDYVLDIRKKIEQRFPDLQVPGISRTSQPFLMARNRIYATTRRSYDRSALQVEGEAVKAEGEAPQKLAVGDFDDAMAPPPPKRRGPDADLKVPAGQRARYEAAFAKFADVFPNTFYISERGRYFPDNTRDKGRFLSAGIHNLMGYFRDDQPLYELILDEKQQKELDTYWHELDFIASANIRTYVQFYLFETREAAKGAEGGAIAPDDKGIISEARIKKVEESYLERARAANNATAVAAIIEHFKQTNDSIRWVEKARPEAEPVHLESLLKFAARAYRRPLTAAEREDLLGYYRTLRTRDGLSHEDAMRDSVVAVLMSPDFCYRIDLVEAGGSRAAGPASFLAAQPARRAAVKPASGVHPLSDYALASRLSYFVWSSMPDEELLARAAAGDLRKPEVLAAQARRMLKDPRAIGLATEFGGNWLDFRRFEEHNAVDRERFPSFDNELRQAMFEEPVRFIADVIQSNRSILDMLYGAYTFVNPVLAKHYGMTVNAKPGQWVRVDNAAQYGRGGLLPMAAFLTKNAPGLRTSPVKRGYWVVRRVLDETIPPPPAVVPELPRDEAKMELPLRDMLAKHREDASCAACHARFDSLGLALEGYGPIGERRTKDLAGHTVDARASFPGGFAGDGMEGIRTYIRQHRQNDFVDGLCRKLIVYALGRSLMLSDEPMVEALRSKLATNGYRMNTLIESIVTSPQFLTKRGPDFVEKGE